MTLLKKLKLPVKLIFAVLIILKNFNIYVNRTKSDTGEEVEYTKAMK